MVWWEQHLNSLVKPIEPVKPLKANKHKHCFTLAVNPLEFPEMKEFKDMIFEVDESKQKYNKSWEAITWESVLSKGDSANKYKITLTKGTQMVILDVYPVLDGKAFEDAMKAYEQKNADYKKELYNYNNELTRSSQAISYANNYHPTQAQLLSYEKANEVMRAFTISNFGVYNMDCIAMLPSGRIVDLDVNGTDGKLFDGFAEMYHVDRQKNCLFSYHNENPMTGFHFNPKSSNLIWAVKNGKLFYAENDQFTKLPASGKSSIVLKEVEKDFKSPEEMKRFSKIGQNSQ